MAHYYFFNPSSIVGDVFNLILKKIRIGARELSWVTLESHIISLSVLPTSQGSFPDEMWVEKSFGIIKQHINAR